MNFAKFKTLLNFALYLPFAMNIISIDTLDASGLAPYRAKKDAVLQADGLIVAESPNVVARALESGVTPMSFLCEEGQLDAVERLIGSDSQVPVYTGCDDTLRHITGFALTRGVLCAMKRPEADPGFLRDGKRICVLYDICDSVNVGAIFRTCAALGIDGIVLDPHSCHPLNRRVIRVSMGTVFQIPWCVCADVVGTLKDCGYELAGMALRRESVFLEDFHPEPSVRCALFMGSEGYGLPAEVIDACDHVVKIRMHRGVDSLNVAAAAAIALWQIST